MPVPSNTASGGLGFSRDHLVRRALGEPVPLRIVNADPPLPEAVTHRNTLPVEAFDLAAERFGAATNLIDSVAAALRGLTGQDESVVSPVGSVVYARRDDRLLWDLVHDIDIWCYVPGRLLAGRSLHQWHVALQKRLHGEFRRRGLRSRLTWPNNYVVLVDDAGRERMIELKIAHTEWLSRGLSVVHHRFCGLRARRGRAYSLKPRLEWAAYSAFENHYGSPAAEDFHSVIARVRPSAAMTGLHFMYHENLAGAMRRFGPAHVLESRASEPRLHRNRQGVLKKILMLSVMRRDEDLRRRTLDELQAPPVVGNRRRAVSALIECLDHLSTLDASVLARWLGPTGPPGSPKQSALQLGEFGEQATRPEQVAGSALLDHPPS